MSQIDRRRPAGVTLVVVLSVIVGIVDVVGGIVLLLRRSSPSLLDATHLNSTSLLGYGIGRIITGVVILLALVPLARGVNFARFVLAIIAIISLFDGVFELLRFPRAYTLPAVVSVILGALVLYLLFFRPGDNAFFLGGSD